MSRTNETQRRNRNRQNRLAGGDRSPDSAPRERRAAQATAVSEQQFNPRQMRVNKDGEMSLVINRERSKKTTATPSLSLAQTSSAPTVHDTRGVSGYHLQAGKTLSWMWPVPGEVDPGKIVSVHLYYWTDNGSAAVSTQTLSARKVADEGVIGADYDQTETFSLNLTAQYQVTKKTIKLQGLAAGQLLHLQLSTSSASGSRTVLFQVSLDYDSITSHSHD